MELLKEVKERVRRLVGRAKVERAARRDKSESDISAAAGVAHSRANTDGNDGSYVGRTTPQFDAEVQESGAEARSEAARRARVDP
jgi:glucosamine 6-phosphate synthetase-like amidotransferase/phosphosugar isomerase protein